jgi:hypothetical protein
MAAFSIAEQNLFGVRDIQGKEKELFMASLISNVR